MKKKILGIFVCMLLITTLFPVMSSVEGNEVETLEKNDLCNSCYQRKDWEFVSNQESNNIWSMIGASSFGNDDKLDQSQESYCGYGWAVWVDLMLAQSFVPTLEILTRVELLSWKRGQPLSLNISIRSDLNGTDLTSINISESEISGVTQWHEFDFPDINVTPGQTYYIVWDPAGSFDIDNTFCWAFGYNNPYDKGCGWLYWGEGDIWEIWDPPDYPGLDFCFRTYGKLYRPSNPIITGPTSGKAGNSYPYTFTSTHPKGDNVSYYIEWGDGGTTDWTAFQASGAPGYSENYTWSAKGTFTIKAKAKDVDGAESDWTTLEVTMPKNKPFNFNFNLLEWLFERFPNAFPILRHMLGL